MTKRESYELNAFTIDRRRAIKQTAYFSVSGLTRGVKMAIDRGADYISIRRIRPEAK